MLVSHKYKFIFIKTRKTAGTSIEIDLSRIMAAEDIVTEIFPEEVGHSPRNYILGDTEFYNHMSCMEVRAALGERLFNSYFKFCVEREPVDKCLSHYSMLNNSEFHNPKNLRITWSDYLSKLDFPVDTEKYIDGTGKLLVDKIVHYENLNDGLYEIFNYLSIPCKSICSRAKANFRDVSLRPSDVCFAHRKIIYEAFRSSCVYTGYSLY